MKIQIPSYVVFDKLYLASANEGNRKLQGATALGPLFFLYDVKAIIEYGISYYY